MTSHAVHYLIALTLLKREFEEAEQYEKNEPRELASAVAVIGDLTDVFESFPSWMWLAARGLCLMDISLVNHGRHPCCRHARSKELGEMPAYWCDLQ
jgi:hypothetical protein